MSINIPFGGAVIRRTGAYSVVDSSSMTPVSLGASNVLAVVGILGTGSTLTGGVYYFNDPKAARDAVKASEMLDLMEIMWAHGADLIAVSPVIATGQGAPVDADWQTALDRLIPEFVDGIVPATTTAAVLTKVDAHVTLASSVTNRKYRRAFYGHAAGLAVSAIADLQTTLNNERGLMASPAVYVYDANGDKVLKGSHYLAAAFAGLWAGQPPQEPITYKYVKVAGLEKNYDATEIVTLLDAHIAPVEYVRNRGYRIVQGITLSSDADLTKSELSVSTLKDVMNLDTISYFEEKYVGKAGVKGIEITIYNDLVSRIISYEQAGWISGYIPDSIKVTRNGTAFFTEWEGTPTLPINNILNTAHFTL